jgi:hypothetical protein
MINSNLLLILAQTYVKLLDNDVIEKGKNSTLVCLTLRGWRHIQNVCGFSRPTAMGQSFIITLYYLTSAKYFKMTTKINISISGSVTYEIVDVPNRLSQA